MSSFEEINALTRNHAQTFEFNHEDAERILFPAFRLDGLESCEDLKLKLERLRFKEARFEMHGSTLSEYWRNKKIPRGLRIQKAPTIGKEDETFLKKWGEILNKCSLDLMLLIIEQVATEAKAIKIEIDAQEKLIQEKFSSMYPNIDGSIKDEVAKYKEKLLTIKLKKYKRDTEDYQNNRVYHWEQDTAEVAPDPAPRSLRTARFGTGMRQQRAHQRNREDSSLDSDFTLDSDSGPSSGSSFLPSRKKYPPKQKGKPGGGGARRAPARPWTRSQT